MTLALAAPPARRGAPGAVPLRRDHPGQHRLRPARAPPTTRSGRRSGRSAWPTSSSGMPDGLDTVVHERGQSLSSGERQLIALARAFLAQPRVLVLDEATSNLDLQSETKIEAALDVLLAGPHRHPHRPPAVDRHAGRPHRRGRRRADRRGRAPTTSWWPPAAATPRCTPPGSTSPTCPSTRTAARRWAERHASSADALPDRRKPQWRWPWRPEEDQTEQRSRRAQWCACDEPAAVRQTERPCRPAAAVQPAALADQPWRRQRPAERRHRGAVLIKQRKVGTQPPTVPFDRLLGAGCRLRCSAEKRATQYSNHRRLRSAPHSSQSAVGVLP